MGIDARTEAAIGILSELEKCNSDSFPPPVLQTMNQIKGNISALAEDDPYSDPETLREVLDALSCHIQNLSTYLSEKDLNIQGLKLMIDSAPEEARSLQAENKKAIFWQTLISLLLLFVSFVPAHIGLSDDTRLSEASISSLLKFSKTSGLVALVPVIFLIRQVRMNYLLQRHIIDPA